MALMLSKTYDALVAAGAPEDKAREAAEGIAVYENRFVRIETDLVVIKADLAGIKGCSGSSSPASCQSLLASCRWC